MISGVMEFGIKSGFKPSFSIRRCSTHLYKNYAEKFIKLVLEKSVDYTDLPVENLLFTLIQVLYHCCHPSKGWDPGSMGRVLV
jgi:hypothetical protein